MDKGENFNRADRKKLSAFKSVHRILVRDGPLMIWGMGGSGREFVLSFFFFFFSFFSPTGRPVNFFPAFARALPQIINGSSLTG